jgi:hypothetical protein
MKRICFLASKDKIADYLATPIRYNIRGLRERGYEVVFRYAPSLAGLESDILCLMSKPALQLLGETEEVVREDGPTLAFLSRCREAAGKIIWFDISDSTGVTHFELLPHVDLYLKKHLLKDRSLYDKPFYGGRIYSDFYHRHFGVTDEKPFTQFHPLAPEQAHKVSLSWNMGLGDMYNSFTKRNTLRRLCPGLLKPDFGVPFVDPGSPRPLDIFLRTSANLGRESVSFDRKNLIARLERLLADHPQVTGSASGRLPIDEYRRRMTRSKIAFGPFGWGELNVKEYEALILGACLVRPDISHMETWPDIFIAGITYQPYAWDFSDLEENVLGLLRDDARRLEIARRGQQAYRDMISPEGMERFCDWFVRQIER